MTKAIAGMPAGVVELLRRLVALVLFVTAATAGFGHGRVDIAALALLAGGLVYALVPRPVPPPGSFHYRRLPSVTMPDLIGFMLATLFFALPFVVSAQRPWAEGPWPLLMMTGLPGLVSLAIFYVASRNQCLWIKAAGGELTIADLFATIVLPFDAIARVRAEEKPAPRWIAPLLVLLGGWRGLGLALANDRPTHNLVLQKRDGATLRLPVDALPDLVKLVAALSRGHVELDAELTAWLGRIAHHPRLRRQAEGGPARTRHRRA